MQPQRKVMWTRQKMYAKHPCPRPDKVALCIHRALINLFYVTVITPPPPSPVTALQRACQWSPTIRPVVSFKLQLR